MQAGFHIPTRLRSRVAFRRALLATAVLTLAAIAALGFLLAMGLAEADGLLARLGRSQDQLARVTYIQGDLNRLRADVATAAPGVEDRVRHIDESLRAYRQSVVDEEAELDAPAEAGQAVELANAQRLIAMFDSLRPRLMRRDIQALAAAELVRFESLTQAIAGREREEAREATREMGDLRRSTTLLAAVISALTLLAGVAGVWIMLAANFSLEGEVRERTSEIEAGRSALAEIDRNRRLFFSKIGHELRTPATVIRGEAEVALRDPAAAPERLREALQSVEAHSQLLQRRLDDMLALAAAEDGRLTLRREPLDIAAVVRGAAGLAEPYVRASGLELRARAPQGAGPSIRGDASWLQQAILALIDNAVKFANGSAPIQLVLTCDEARAQIIVSDNGPGVDPTDLPHLFETYYQAAGGRARGGSGLGLSVARWVVEQHGGEIHARSLPGEGLTVEIDLPVRA